MRRILTAMAVAIVLVVALAACGSSGSSRDGSTTTTASTDSTTATSAVQPDGSVTTATTTPSSDGTSNGGASERNTAAITKSEFLKQGNAACDELTDSIGEASKDIDVSDSAAVKRFLLTTAVPAAEHLIDTLEGLGTPAGDGATLDELYAAMRRDIAKVKANPGSTDDSEANPLLAAYGLTSCSDG